MSQTNDPNQPKGKSFKSIADLLKMDGSTGFDAIEAEKELADLEARKNQIAEFKNKFAEIEKLTCVDDYMSGVLKQLVGKGMVMLDALQHEIEDNPRGRDVETAAAMMTSINGVIDNINKIKVSNARLNFEQQKIDMKKASITGPQMQPNQNILMVGTTNDLMDFLLQKKAIPDGNAPTPVMEVDITKTEEPNVEDAVKDDAEEDI